MRIIDYVLPKRFYVAHRNRAVSMFNHHSVDLAPSDDGYAFTVFRFKWSAMFARWKHVRVIGRRLSIDEYEIKSLPDY